MAQGFFWGAVLGLVLVGAAGGACACSPGYAARNGGPENNYGLYGEYLVVLTNPDECEPWINGIFVINSERRGGRPTYTRAQTSMLPALHVYFLNGMNFWMLGGQMGINSGSVRNMQTDSSVPREGWEQTCKNMVDWTPTDMRISIVLEYQCVACPAGTFKDTVGDEACTPCNFWNGEFSAAGAAVCAGCAVDQYMPPTVAGGVQCIACAAGTFALPGATACTSAGCPAGQFYHAARARCVQCAPGSYKAGLGLQPCVACPAGAGGSALPGAASAFECACLPGFGNPGLGGAGCTPCAPGESSAGAGAACAACAPGDYAARAGSERCLPCPAGFFAVSAGSALCEQCADGELATAERTGCLAPAAGACAAPDVRVAAADLPAFVRVE